MNPQLAQAQINKMKGSLSQWLKWRTALVKVARGDTPGDSTFAEKALEQYHPEEIALAEKLGELLGTIDPSGDYSNMDPVELAQAAIKEETTSPTPQGSILPWVIGGGTLIILFTIKNLADAAKEKRALEACKAGIKEACPFPWKRVLLLSGLAVGGYVVWTKTDFKEWIGGAFGTRKALKE